MYSLIQYNTMADSARQALVVDRHKHEEATVLVVQRERTVSHLVNLSISEELRKCRRDRRVHSSYLLILSP